MRKNMFGSPMDRLIQHAKRQRKIAVRDGNPTFTFIVPRSVARAYDCNTAPGGMLRIDAFRLDMGVLQDATGGEYRTAAPTFKRRSWFDDEPTLWQEYKSVTVVFYVDPQEPETKPKKSLLSILKKR